MQNKSVTPKTKIKEVVDTIHGVKITDPYRWMEKDGKEIDSWITAQNKYTRSFLDKIPARKSLKKRFEEVFHIDSVGMPVPKGSRYFFIERKGRQDLSVFYFQEGLKGKPKVLIDPNKLSEDKTTTLKGCSVSDDGKLVAYSLSEAGNDQASIYVLDVDTGKRLKDHIPAEFYPSLNVTWNTDKSGFWYLHRDFKAPKGEEKFHKRLYFHKLGDNFEKDVLVFGENLAKEDSPHASISKNGKYLLVQVYLSSTKKERTEIYLKDLIDKNSKFIPVIKDVDSLFGGFIYNETIFINTNHQAPNYKIMSVSIEDAAKGIKAWKTVIPEDKKSVITNYIIIKDQLFLESMRDVCSALHIYSTSGKLISEIKLPALGSLAGISGKEDGDELFYGFSSYTIPFTISRYDLNSHRSEEFKKVNLNLDDQLFIVKQIWYPSKDGTKIPMFVVHKKNLKMGGNNPTVLYGYGGFNINITPGFNRAIIPFLEDGGVYVEVILRGGGEFGEKWHEMGMKEKKQNVFDDFIYAAQWLIKNKYTNPKKIGISGWSNGGLLTAASMIQRPELYQAVIIGAPVLDMFRYHMFHGGRHWIQEYGSIEDKNEFKYLLKYSPYHNVKLAENYPATLFLTADKDDRVDPMHAFKMVAKLQKANTSENPTLIRIEIKAGHSGASPMYKVVDQYTDMWSFIYWQLGI